METDPARTLKERLRGDLRTALKQGNPDHARVLRTLVAAIDNAEAPILDPRLATFQSQFGDGSNEVQRLTLGADNLRDLLSSEINERQVTEAHLEKAGRSDEAQVVAKEIQIIGGYLD